MTLITRRELLASGAGLALMAATGGASEGAAGRAGASGGYREVLRFATGFQRTYSVAFAPSGDLWVGGDRSVRLFGPRGHRQQDLPLKEAPTCLATDADGTLFVGVRRAVLTFDSHHRLRSRWAALGTRSYITCVAPSKDKVWVADAGSRLALGYSRKGAVLHRIGERDPSRHRPGLIVPSAHLDVAPAPDGSVWVCNPGRHRMERYSVQGELLHTWGRPSPRDEGFWGCCNPTDFALLPNGGFITSEKGVYKVKRFSPEGRFERLVAGPESFAGSRLTTASAGVPLDGRESLLSLPCTSFGMDVDTDSRGRVLVLDPVANLVRLLVPKELA
jgi:hypothetical protein